MVQIWRCYILPRAGKCDADYSFSLCLDRGILGCGWAVDVTEGSRLDAETYLRLNEEEHGPGQAYAVRRLMKMDDGDLIWTRSPTNTYFLGKVIGPWEYRAAQEYVDADLVNVRPVRLIEVGTEESVPGKVVSCLLRRGSTLQRILDETALRYTLRIWAEATGEHIAEPNMGSAGDIFSLLSAEDVEDVVFVYLQYLGWLVRPARRRRQTPVYEFSLVHREDGREAVVQVKTGRVPVDLSALPTSVDVAFAFQPNGLIEGSNPVGQVVSRDEVHAFMKTHPSWLPESARIWLEKV